MSANSVKKLLTRLSAVLAATVAAGAAAATFSTAAASGVLVYNSYAQFAADIASHAIAPAYTWVMYDPEYWALTPLNEQQNPGLYMQQFGQLAHAHGLKVIEAPGRDLALVPGAACPQARRRPDGHRRQVRPRRRHLHQRHVERPGQDQVLPPRHADRRLLNPGPPVHRPLRGSAVGSAGGRRGVCGTPGPVRHAVPPGTGGEGQPGSPIAYTRLRPLMLSLEGMKTLPPATASGAPR